MTVKVNTDGNVSLCYKDTYINIAGAKANLVIAGAFVMLLFVGIAALAKSN